MTMEMPPAPAVTVRPRRSANRMLDVALVAAAALAIGGVAFGIGRATAPSVPAGFAGDGPVFQRVGPDGSFDPGAGPRGGIGFGGGPTIDGTVTSVSGNAVTVKLSDGQEMTFTLDSSTTYHQATAGTATDVAVGDDVSVRLKGGARFQAGANASAPPQLSASDVTVRR